jgi:hypothetical protein
MSIEDIEQDAQSDEQPEGGSDESYDSGEMGDGAFVSEQAKKPMSKSTVVMILIILCAKAGMYFMWKRSTPAKADAADVKSTQVIKQFMSDKEKNFSLMKKMIDETESVVNQFTNYPNLKQVPLAQLQTNPFKMVGGKQEEDTSERERLKREKEEKDRIEAEKRAVEKALAGIRLQSIVTSGARKACMINNTLYMVGQVVDVDGVQFTIEDIAPNKVSIRNGKYGAELSMKK